MKGIGILGSWSTAYINLTALNYGYGTPTDYDCVRVRLGQIHHITLFGNFFIREFHPLQRTA